jgi:hypothetical protein
LMEIRFCFRTGGCRRRNRRLRHDRCGCRCRCRRSIRCRS